MEIYILRHGIAENAKPGQPDADRALTSEGRDKLRRVLKRARAAEVAPSLILTSPLRRAIETADIAAQVLGYKNQIGRTRTLEPEASPHDTWEEIRSHKEESALLMASHEPLTASLVAFLLDCPALQIDVKKGALVRMDCDRFGSSPRCVLKWILTPGLASD